MVKDWLPKEKEEYKMKRSKLKKIETNEVKVDAWRDLCVYYLCLHSFLRDINELNLYI